METAINLNSIKNIKINNIAALWDILNSILRFSPAVFRNKACLMAEDSRRETQ